LLLFGRQIHGYFFIGRVERGVFYPHILTNTNSL
jgi:hypothetical protein